MKKFLVCVAVLAIAGLSPLCAQPIEMGGYIKRHDTLFRIDGAITPLPNGGTRIFHEEHPVLVGVPQRMDPENAVMLLRTGTVQCDTQRVYSNREFPFGILFEKKESRIVSHELFKGDGLPSIRSVPMMRLQKSFVPRSSVIAGLFTLLFLLWAWRQTIKTDMEKQRKRSTLNVTFLLIGSLILWFFLAGAISVACFISKYLRSEMPVPQFDANDLAVLVLFSIVLVTLFLSTRRSMLRKDAAAV